MKNTHRQLVRMVAERVRSFYANKRPFYVYHGSTNSTRVLSFKRDEMIDVSALNRVLSVDPANQTAIAEPNVPMDKLIRATLKHGLVPPVVMEFPGITVGGGIQGGAGESGSFRWGCFNRICNWYEMVLANGDVVKVSPAKNAELYNGAAGSFGTLGIVTAAEIKLVPARKYVQLTYVPVGSFDEAVSVLSNESAAGHDYIDGVMFGPDNGLIMLGVLSDEKVGRLQRFARARDPWFYLHAGQVAVKAAAAAAPITETIPLTDYLFRYDRGAFWVGRFAFERFGVPYNAFTRWLLNPILHTRKLYQALQESGASQEHVVQDLALPQDRAARFMKFIDQSLQVYPLWLCPIKPDPTTPLLCNSLPTSLVINVGVWGSRISNHEKFLEANRDIETKLSELGGKKWFYAHSYYTKDEFWRIYDKSWYDALRDKYHATTLPSIYDKIRVKDRYEVNAKRGLIKTILGRAGLRVRD